MKKNNYIYNRSTKGAVFFMGFLDFFKKKKVNIVTSDYSDHRKRIDDLKNKQFKNERFNNIYFPLYNCLVSLNEIKMPYFTYVKHIQNIKINLYEVVDVKKDELYNEAKLTCIKVLEKDFDNFNLDEIMKSLMENPNQFLLNINNFHKNILLNSVDSLYQYWISVVKDLKQKSAKKKRQKYVIEGYLILKNELLKLNPSLEEIKKIDSMIKKITVEDWSIL